MYTILSSAHLSFFFIIHLTRSFKSPGQCLQLDNATVTRISPQFMSLQLASGGIHYSLLSLELLCWNRAAHTRSDTVRCKSYSRTNTDTALKANHSVLWQNVHLYQSELRTSRSSTRCAPFTPGGFAFRRITHWNVWASWILVKSFTFRSREQHLC